MRSTSIPIPRPAAFDGWPYLGLLAVGAALWFLCARHPAMLPFWAPWEFSWVEYLSTVLSLFWFARGLRRTAPPARLAPWRRILFVLGVVMIYAVLETHFEYMAEHMFFINRIQHIVMHHLGPFLIALGFPGETIWRGMPEPLKRPLRHPALGAAMRVIQQPALAAFLFVGLIYLWLYPPIHFRAMINPDLFALMNWSMVVDGILFWCLVLDPRPRPLARTTYGIRLLIAFLVMLPQIALGSYIAFATRDYFPFYDLCGRLYPSFDALRDQTWGGLIIWIPAAMMSVVGFLLILNFMRLNEDATAMEEPLDDQETIILSSRWTGR
mgnify:FL=1